MIRHDVISGSKGGGGGQPPPPVNTPDNLRSNDSIECLLAISEGPIAGLSNGLKSFKVGQTQLVNDLNEPNFQNFSLTEYSGQPDQAVKMKFGGQSRSQSVGVALFSGTSVIRQTLFGNIDYIDIRLVINRLYSSGDTGTFPLDIQFTIEYRAHSAPVWLDAFADHIIKLTGKTTSNYVKEFRFPVPSINEPYDIRVTKISPESDSVHNFRDISWESYQEINATVKTYHDLAMVRLVGQATDQFSSIPDFNGQYDGLIINVPTNFNPRTHTTTGVWDGTFKKECTNCGPWILYDYVVNDRYGMSAYSPITIDKWDIYEAAAWCNEQVNDGKGGTEPRWTFNNLIADLRNGKEMGRFLAGTFNGVFFDDLNGLVKLRVDKDDPATHLFTKENIVDGRFTYSYTDETTRYNDINVVFINPDLDNTEDTRRVFNQADIDLNGRVPLEFAAIGCQSEREALRRGYYKMITALTEKEIIQFKVNRLGQYVQPFDVMLCVDPEMGYALSGRVKTFSEDRLTLNLRDPIYLETGINYTLHAFSPSQGMFTRTVTTATTGSVMALTVNAPLPSDSADRMTFALEQTGSGYGAPKPYRVIFVEEVDGSPDQFTIEGVEINRNKWDAVDNLSFTGGIEYSFLPNPTNIPPPESINFHTGYFRANRQRQLFIDPILNKATYPYYNGEFDVYSRLQTDPTGWTKLTLINGDTVINHDEGAFDFRVVPKNFFGAQANLSAMPSFPYTVSYTIDRPSEVQGFTSNITYAGLILAWTLNPEPDIDFYEIREGLSWDAGEVIVTNQSGNSFLLPKKKLGSVTYHIAASAAGKYSQPVSLTINVLAPATVKDFQVIQNNDHILFNWTPNTEPDLDVYEIREGLTWSTGLRITKINGTRWSMPSNSVSNRQFWIKAVDKSKNESVIAAAANTEFRPTDDYNIIIGSDEAYLGFPGQKNYTEVSGTRLVLSAGKYYGEYVHEIDLGATVYARNVIDMAVDSVVNDTLTWAASTFAWNSTEAQRSWAPQGDIDSVMFGQEVAQEAPLPAAVVEGWRLNGGLIGINGTTTATASGATYLPGRFTDGLYVQDTTDVSWVVAIPSSFRLDFWYRPKDVTHKVGILQLKGAAGKFLQLWFDGSIGTPKFTLEDDSGNQIQFNSFTGGLAIDDLIYVSIIQTATQRTVYLGRLSDKQVITGTAAFATLGALTSIDTKTMTGVTKRANAVLSDLLLTTSGGYTAADFATAVVKVAPPGYGNFRLFLPGDYQYRRAIFRETMIAASSDRPRVLALKLSVDVPDVVDRSAGTVSLVAGDNEIFFNRTFLVVPEVYPSIVTAANDVVLRITAISKTSFHVEARNAANAYAVASFRWFAHKY